MSQRISVSLDRLNLNRLSFASKLALAAWALMALTYTCLFTWLAGDGFVSSAQRALINTVPAALLSWPILRLIEKRLIGQSLVRQSVEHFLYAVCFSILWYIGIQVGYGLRSGWAEAGIIGRPLLGVALTWQMFQGGTLYAAIAGFTYAMFYRTQFLSLQEATQAASKNQVPAKREQIFVKDGSVIKPVALSDILLLSGAGDYTEVVTRDGKYLSSTSLSDFETDLPADRFLRAHRSHIVAADHILSVESGGNGRLTLHLPRGLSVTTSRSGAARFKASTV